MDDLQRDYWMGTEVGQLRAQATDMCVYFLYRTINKMVGIALDKLTTCWETR